ncbi:phage tail tape measure protein [Erwiniaceae bacterium BAC15a-03b]|uniref:Phage tail tape measure protein n=1 Tax=Winslowiella arboricola TaxID=2978220 RepID=A0A9J6PLS7_9GAMM|nr:phage tail tape measure protein [Winslowiella arboricola]MCU5775868.1 phage tail tape measure protein [Winslowiella arboricola]MCU5779281.1 phage tail tape measure protein [Winslowiella arboricola]
MSNNLKLQVLLKAVDQATRPFKAIQTATKSLSSGIRDTQAGIKALDQQAAKIDGFRKTSAQLAVTKEALQKAKDEAAALAVQFRNTAQPTNAQAKALEAAKRAAAELQSKSNSLRLSVQQQREALKAAGISTKNLSSEQQQLRSSSAQATVSLSRQKMELQRLNQQQEKLNRTSERFRNGQVAAGKMRNMGAAGVGAATVGAVAGASVLRPGYEFAQANSTLQATLGLDKTSPEFQSLRTQARQIGDNTAASAGDAANAQIVIAKAGGNVDDIRAATPVTLNMSLANNRTMEESASLLMSTKSAFGMANSEVAHLGDVISATLNKTAANFDGLSDALTYIAPVAKNAGVSVEQTTAMIGLLAKNGITGSMAGTGARAMLSRLQAPTGQAFSAIKELGVKTADNKGNMRPFFTILKEMQHAFEKNKLGTAQQAEYMKTIFGEEAASSAATLLKSAASGALDELTKTFQGSDGATEKLVRVQQDNLGGDFKELDSAREAIGTDLFDQMEGSLRKLTQNTTKFLLSVDKWIQANPELAGGITKAATAGLIFVGALGAIGLIAWPVVTGVSALVAVAGFLGTAFTVAGGAIAAALGAISLPVVAVVALFTAGALLIRKYWEPISAFMSGVAEGFTAAMGPVTNSFGSLKPVLAWITDKVKAVINWFKELITPVKASQEQLESAADMGKKFGNMLAEGLKIPSEALDQLRSGIDWVLEKLGIIDKQSDGLGDKVPQPEGPALGGAGYDTTYSYNPALGGAAGYSPVTAGAGSKPSSQNSYHSEYTINMHPGMTKDDALSLMAENRAREKRQAAAQERSIMGWED